MVSEPIYHTIIFFSENLLATETKKTHIHINKPVHLEISMLELDEFVMYVFWYDYVKQKYGEKAKCILRVQIVLLYTQKRMIFIKRLQKMLKQSFSLQIMIWKGLYQKERTKGYWFNKG